MSYVSAKKPRYEFRALLGDVSEPSGAFEVTAMDIYGPLPKRENVNFYLLTFLDHLA
jgi:hypothetical protein